MSEIDKAAPKRLAKLGDTIYTQLSAFSNHRVLRVQLVTQDALDYANSELIAKGRWRVEEEKS